MRRRHSRSGAALVEFAVAMIAVLVMLVGFVHFMRFGMARTKAVKEARAEAGEYAMLDGFFSDLPGPKFLYDWNPGPDGIRHSADDVEVTGSPADMDAGILDHARPQDLETWAPGNQVSSLAGSDIATGMGLIHGQAQEREIEVDSLVRELFCDRDVITVEGHAWMVWTKGIE